MTMNTFLMKKYIIICLSATYLLALTVFGCEKGERHASHELPSSEKNASPLSGTAQMIDSLKAVYQRTQFMNNPYSTNESTALKEQMIEKAKERGENINVKFYLQYAFGLLESGRTEEAIAIFQQVKQQLDQFKVLNDASRSMYETLAIAYMRLGEQQNCILNHSDESCIFPIQGKGIHTKKKGSSKAIEYYKQLLTAYPNDLQSRWLLNLAYMTLDEYPQSVPKQWLIPASTFASEYPFPKFDNIASGLQLDINELAGGIIADDMNNDGWPDIYLPNMTGPNMLWINHPGNTAGERSFKESGAAAGVQLPNESFPAWIFDYNNVLGKQNNKPQIFPNH